ncbi:MAG TPA: tyrosine-type recombinase/integrase [Pseudolabrys sp.]|nr:tyrosine-type recombinase/integrase [Pseudolabrys sp.]
MTRVRLRGWFATYKVLKSGERVAYYYHRATGNRLHGEPGSSQFVADYAAAERYSKDRLLGTFAGLVRDYLQSVEFQENLSESTQAEYRRMLTAAEGQFDDLPQSALNDPGVRKDFLDWREKVARASGDREADNRLSAISTMLTWAVERGKLQSNHLRGFKRLYHSDRSEIIWLPEHISRFMKVAPLEMQRALILALHTGQRESDILRLAWSAYDGQVIRLRQGKSRRRKQPGRLIEVPCSAALRRMLDRMKRISPLILTTKTGQGFKRRYFAHTWRKAALTAGLTKIALPGREDLVDLHFHDLRGTAVTLLSEAGCTPQQIATITGHSLKTVHRILERYLARTRGLAEQAIANFENSPRTKFANQLQTKRQKNKRRKRK